MQTCTGGPCGPRRDFGNYQHRGEEWRATWPREGVGMDEGLGGALRAQGTGGERGGVRERERREPSGRRKEP